MSSQTEAALKALLPIIRNATNEELAFIALQFAVSHPTAWLRSWESKQSTEHTQKSREKHGLVVAPETEEQALKALSNGYTMEAIAIVRRATGASLEVARNYVKDSLVPLGLT